MNNTQKAHTLYKAVIAPRGSFTSALQSDTFFGAFCWSYLRLFGNTALEGLIANCMITPPIVFSNAFPAGTLPLPMGIRDTESIYDATTDKRERVKAYRANKKLKNSRFVAESVFARIINGDSRGITASLQSDETTSRVIMHNMVSRKSNTVENIDGAGNLFGREETFAPPNKHYDVYILSTLPPDILTQVFALALEMGIGGKKSTGKGCFGLVSLRPHNGFALSNPANGFVALSNFIPAQNDPTQGYYKTLVKFPRLDREFSATETPFKKPMLFITSGAIFYDSQPRLLYGRCIANVSALDKPVIVNACTIAILACLP